MNGFVHVVTCVVEVDVDCPTALLSSDQTDYSGQNDDGIEQALMSACLKFCVACKDDST